jgi:hypothetical protein
MIKYVNPAPFSFDLSGKLNYLKGLLIIGVSHRRKDFWSVIGGTSLLDPKLQFCYSYGITQSSLRKVNNDSHEIILGYRFQLKSHIVCPRISGFKKQRLSYLKAFVFLV